MGIAAVIHQQLALMLLLDQQVISAMCTTVYRNLFDCALPHTEKMHQVMSPAAVQVHERCCLDKGEEPFQTHKQQQCVSNQRGCNNFTAGTCMQRTKRIASCS
jgi:hypothetical protein